ncbi:MAG: cob(I)yrinic acid a,c-diamide adenosyltransferase [Syntrophomonadaceae bacterium]|nr:cob(I)yrinic acid a,c-diamide adenosyltransferase [Syntrophomonadaceae bacterium]
MTAREFGLIHVYTGPGKGKTTAAIGQAVRSLGAGMRVIMVNFLKNPNSSEFNALNRLSPEFKYIIGNQEPRGFYWQLSEDQKKAAGQDYRLTWGRVKEIVDRHQCELLILDEIMAVIEYGILTVDSVIEIMKQSRKAHIELILTGRNAPTEIMLEADLVTEMIEIKHPFKKGIRARRGIEY